MASIPPSADSESALQQLLRELLTDGLWDRVEFCFVQQRHTGEKLAPFFERRGVCNRMCLSILNLADKKYISPGEAGPLLRKEKFVEQVRSFLGRTGIDWKTLLPDLPDLHATPAAVPAPVVRPEFHEVPPELSTRPTWQDREVPRETPSESTTGRPPENEPDPEESVLDAYNPLAGTLPPGMPLGKYVIERLIGRGGFGAVYFSTHPTLRVPVAIKVLRALNSNEAHEAFLAEARLIAQLNHPSIVRVWDFDEDARRRPYLVLEYVDGATMSDLLRQRGRLPAAAALGIVRDVAGGLQAAARLGIIHKDVKPANILISRDGAVKLTDFGVATVSDKRLGSRLSIRTQAENLVSGTIDYMPPEQAQGEKVDGRSDMYALGVTFYQAVTGKLPFVGVSAAQVLVKQMVEKPPTPAELLPGLPQLVSDTIMRMMARLPEDRFPNYQELLKALDRCEQVLTAAPRNAVWAAEAQAAEGPNRDTERSTSVWNWLKRGAKWFIKQ